MRNLESLSKMDSYEQLNDVTFEGFSSIERRRGSNFPPLSQPSESSSLSSASGLIGISRRHPVEVPPKSGGRRSHVRKREKKYEVQILYGSIHATLYQSTRFIKNVTVNPILVNHPFKDPTPLPQSLLESDLDFVGTSSLHRGSTQGGRRKANHGGHTHTNPRRPLSTSEVPVGPLCVIDDGNLGPKKGPLATAEAHDGDDEDDALAGGARGRAGRGGYISYLPQDPYAGLSTSGDADRVSSVLGRCLKLRP